jgi:hypothetical protein
MKSQKQLIYDFLRGEKRLLIVLDMLSNSLRGGFHTPLAVYVL